MAIEDLTKAAWILLPGTLCTGAVFNGFLDALGVAKSQRRVIEMSKPTIADYASLQEMAQGTVVCGFSLGAIVAAHYADRLGAAHLVLFGLNPLADDPAKATNRRDMAADVIAQGGSAALADRLPAFNGPNPAQVAAQVTDMADETAAMINAQTDLALHRPGALPALAAASCPVYALTGGDDQMAPPDLGQRAAEAAPRGQFHRLDGLGHYALLEDPQACASALAAMMATATHTA